jgi:hypothetical protein
MNRQDINILKTTTTADSGWMDISQFEDWSLFVDALESGSSIKVYGLFNVTAPVTPSTQQGLPDVTTGAYLGTTLNGGGGPYMISDQSFLDSCSPPNAVKPHMLLVKKTQGGSPAETNVYMFSWKL